MRDERGLDERQDSCNNYIQRIMKLPQVASTPRGAIHMLGRALMLAQLFESDVVRTFTTFEKMSGKMPASEKLETEWEKRSKFTLGRILKKYSDRWPKIDGFLETFQRAVEARNWIIHKSFIQNAKLLYSRQGELEFIELVNKRYLEMTEGYELVLVIEDAICERTGYTKEKRIADYLADTTEFMKYTGQKS
jgi:hypothetical protein